MCHTSRIWCMVLCFVSAFHLSGNTPDTNTESNQHESHTNSYTTHLAAFMLGAASETARLSTLIGIRTACMYGPGIGRTDETSSCDTNNQSIIWTDYKNPENHINFFSGAISTPVWNYLAKSYVFKLFMQNPEHLTETWAYAGGRVFGTALTAVSHGALTLYGNNNDKINGTTADKHGSHCVYGSILGSLVGGSLASLIELEGSKVRAFGIPLTQNSSQTKHS